MHRLQFGLAALLGACASEPPTTAPATSGAEQVDHDEGAAPDSAGAPTMLIAPFNLQAEGTTIVVAEDGMITVGGQDNGQLRPNGSFVNDGEVLASLDGDKLSIGGREVGTLGSDGTASVEGFSLRYDDAGRLVGGDGDGPSLVLTPADTPARRAAMLLTLVLTL